MNIHLFRYIILVNAVTRKRLSLRCLMTITNPGTLLLVNKAVVGQSKKWQKKHFRDETKMTIKASVDSVLAA